MADESDELKETNGLPYPIYPRRPRRLEVSQLEEGLFELRGNPERMAVERDLDVAGHIVDSSPGVGESLVFWRIVKWVWRYGTLKRCAAWSRLKVDETEPAVVELCLRSREGVGQPAWAGHVQDG